MVKIKDKHLLGLDLLTWHENDPHVRINGELAFILYDRYGFPKEMVENQINLMFKENPKLRVAHITKAFDKFNKTNYLDKLKQQGTTK